MAGDQPAKHALVSFHPFVQREMGNGMEVWSFTWPFAQEQLCQQGLEDTLVTHSLYLGGGDTCRHWLLSD